MNHAEELGFGQVTGRGVRAVEGPARTAGVHRILTRCAPGSEAGADAAGSARGSAFPLLRPCVGVQARVARRGASAGARDERRPVFVGEDIDAARALVDQAKNAELLV